MEMKVSFPGGKRVDVAFGDFVVHTDQSVKAGGEGLHPEPYSYFLASIAACAGIYVLVFCASRGIPTDGIDLVQRTEFDPKTHRLGKLTLTITLPPSFPEKYRDAVARAAEGCAVKRTIESPPEFVVETVVA